jgi:anti-anti-sigma regulatory factor
MTCKIDRLADSDNRTVLRICGRIQVEHVSTIAELMGKECRSAVLDLTEVMLVDRDVVTFLAACDRQGVELKHCPAFLKEWIAKEQLR